MQIFLKANICEHENSCKSSFSQSVKVSLFSSGKITYGSGPTAWKVWMMIMHQCLRHGMSGSAPTTPLFLIVDTVDSSLHTCHAPRHTLTIPGTTTWASLHAPKTPGRVRAPLTTLPIALQSSSGYPPPSSIGKEEYRAHKKVPNPLLWNILSKVIVLMTSNEHFRSVRVLL